MAPPGHDADLQSTISLVKSLLNAQLKEILRSEHLVLSGNKSTLQTRIINHLVSLSLDGRERFDRTKRFIYAVAGHTIPSSPAQPPPSSYRPSPAAPAPLPPPNRPQYPVSSSQNASPGRLTFKESPFYTIVEPLTPIAECKGKTPIREHTRDNVELKVILSTDVVHRLQNDTSLRIMVYGAADNGMTQYSRCDIAFPYQVELKANFDEVKTNLRGLKNQPGTTRPADITNYIRKKPGYPNHVVLTYALTQKKFYIVVNLVQRHSVEDLARQLKLRKTISSEQVIRDMKSKAQDTDIVATSSIMSLKCPLSTLRINVPCRTSLCMHTQCFDASSFLELQEQAPTWSCPVCNKSTSFEALQVDQYVDNILRATPSTVEQVVVEPNGEWSVPGDESESVERGRASDDDDLVELSSGRPALKQEHTPVRFSLGSSSPAKSREPSSVSSAVRSSSNKRPASEVVDLTLSDEDEAPQPPPKRPMHHQPNGHVGYPPNYSSGYSSNNANSNTLIPNNYYFDV